MLKFVTAVYQVMTELTGAVPEEQEKLSPIFTINETKFFPNIFYLMQMLFGGNNVSSVDSCRI
jgi:hypothetical protein